MLPANFDRESGIPVYRQLADFLKRQIASGAFKPGDVLPSEAELIRQFNVSRTTVRLAFEVIRNNGMVRRDRGKGTVVVSQVHSRLPELGSFSQEVERLGRTPGTVLLSACEEKLTGEAAEQLRLPVSTVVTKAIRVRTADGDPIGIAIGWFNTILFPALKTIDYSAPSLYDMYEQGLGLTMRSATENVRADLATEFEARTLKIKRRSPVLRLRRTTYVIGEAASVVPIEYVEAVFNAYIYTVDVELFRRSSA